MTIGELINEIKDLIKRLLNSLPIKETVGKAVDVVSELPGKMRNSFTEIINGEQWGWIFAFVFCVVAFIILWKSMGNVVDFVIRALIYVSYGILALAFLACLVNGRIDIAVVLLLIVIVLLVNNHFYPKPPAKK